MDFMLNRTDPSKETLPAHREQCYVCHRAKINCLCASIKPFSTKLHFVILMHDEEAKKQKTGTGRLSRLCLKNSELLIGTDFSADERVNALLSDPSYTPFVLYPGPKAFNFQTLGKDMLPPGKTLLIFVIDGTWRTAKSLLRKSPNVSALPRISFAHSYLSQFKIKKQPMEHCVSTIEAIYYLCQEAEAAGYEDCKAQKEVLLAVFNKMVDIQLRYSKEHHKRREDNKKKNA